MYSYGPPHMAGQKQDDQLEHTYSSSVRIRDVALKTCQRWWTIGRSGERGSGISVLAARHDDDDDDLYWRNMSLTKALLQLPTQYLPYLLGNKLDNLHWIVDYSLLEKLATFIATIFRILLNIQKYWKVEFIFFSKNYQKTSFFFLSQYLCWFCPISLSIFNYRWCSLICFS